jgi:molybdopterin-containing oxidoreductase family molybdopterin binding subunit
MMKQKDEIFIGKYPKKIIVAIPNDWLLLPIQNVLYGQDLIFANTLSELYQAVKEESSQGIVVIDIFAYDEKYQTIIRALKQINPQLPIIFLLSSTELKFRSCFEESDQYTIVESKRLNHDLLPALTTVIHNQQVREINSSLVSSTNQEAAQTMTHENSNILKHRFSRRSFLKGSAAAVVTSAALVSTGTGTGDLLSALAPNTAVAAASSAPDEKVYQCVCRGDCGGGTCHMNVHVRGGKVVKTSKIDAADPLYTRICQKGLSHPQRIYAPERLKYPMRRTGKRGEGKWERITWDEAINEICTKWKGYREQYGNSSIMYGTGAGTSSPEQYYYMRLFMAMGASSLYEAYDMGGLYLAALMVTRGPYLHGNSGNSILSAKNIFFWGANATNSQQAGWAVTQSAIVDHGAKAIVIDPNYTLTASKANKWVPIQPGTDAVMMMAMTKVIIDEGLQDTDYLLKGTVAPFLVKESDGKFLRLSDLGRATKGQEGSSITLNGEASSNTVAGAGDDAIVVMGKDGTVDKPSLVKEPLLKGTFTIQGIKVTTAYDLLVQRLAEYPPEKAAEICDVPVETIKELAHTFVDGPTTNFVDYGMDHWGNGYCAYYALYTLMFVAGQFGKWGAGMYGGQQASMGNGTNITAGVMSARTITPGPTIYSPYLPDVMKSGKWGDQDVTIKSLFSYCGNPLMNHTDRKAMMEAIDKIDLFIVADQTMNNTSRYADIILPTPHWFEFETLTTVVTDYARINEKAIDPLYESKTDVDIANLLGKGMGLSDVMNMTGEQYLRTILENPVAKSYGLTLDTLRKEKNIRVQPPKFIFGENYTLPTPTGRAEFYQESVVPNASFGQMLDQKQYSLTHWIPPLEAWHENPLFQKYPLILMSHRDKYKVHSMFTDCSWLTELRTEPTLSINPVDAAKRGIKNGDYVKAYNDRGYVVLKAVLHAGMRPGVVDTEKAWRTEQYKEGCYMDMTSRKQNPFVCNNGFFDTLCEVTKA